MSFAIKLKFVTIELSNNFFEIYVKCFNHLKFLLKYFPIHLFKMRALPFEQKPMIFTYVGSTMTLTLFSKAQTQLPNKGKKKQSEAIYKGI